MEHSTGESSSIKTGVIKKTNKPHVIIGQNTEHMVANHQNVVQELNWNQRIGRNVIGQKSELEKVFLKRKIKSGIDGRTNKDYNESSDSQNYLTEANLPQEYFQKFISIKRNQGSDEIVNKSKEMECEEGELGNQNCEFRKIFTKVTKGIYCNATADTRPISAK